MSGRVVAVNVGRAEPNASGAKRPTGIVKRPVDGRVTLSDPGPSNAGGPTISGVAGDFVGDRRHHGGTYQAVYAFAAEELDAWAEALGRPLQPGDFGENLTTSGVEVDTALVGERWRIGTAVVRVTAPRIPCATFAARMGERGWVRRFAARGRTGAYLAVETSGDVGAGDAVELLHRPAHGVTVERAFRIVTTEKASRAELLAATDDLEPEMLAFARS